MDGTHVQLRSPESAVQNKLEDAEAEADASPVEKQRHFLRVDMTAEAYFKKLFSEQQNTNNSPYR